MPMKMANVNSRYGSRSSSISTLNLDDANVHVEPFLYHAVYEIREAGKKGLGVFSRQDMMAGSHVLTESPLLKAHFDPVTKSSKNLIFNYNKLDAVDKEAWASLHKSSRSDDPIWSPFQANAFHLPENECVVYNHGSRLNHSCQPNCNTANHGGKMVILTNRAIVRGEELTISYDAEVTIKELEDRMGFKCKCDFCRKRQKWYKKKCQVM